MPKIELLQTSRRQDMLKTRDRQIGNQSTTVGTLTIRNGTETVNSSHSGHFGGLSIFNQSSQYKSTAADREVPLIFCLHGRLCTQHRTHCLWRHLGCMILRTPKLARANHVATSQLEAPRSVSRFVLSMWISHAGGWYECYNPNCTTTSNPSNICKQSCF